MHMGNKSNRRLFLRPPGIEVRHKKKIKKKKQSIHVKQPTQSVPQPQVLSIKTILNAQAALHSGIVLYQHSSSDSLLFPPRY